MKTTALFDFCTCVSKSPRKIVTAYRYPGAIHISCLSNCLHYNNFGI